MHQSVGIPRCYEDGLNCFLLEDYNNCASFYMEGGYSFLWNTTAGPTMEKNLEIILEIPGLVGGFTS